ncbi:MAG: proteasome assembly chaperone family protein, partial [Halobacteriota archaeon]|nr:proteasome assembly chaperone family protein [Halobacteriota archaeon]
MSDEMNMDTFGAVEVRSRKIQSSNPIVIEGFPGIGLIGNITGQHIINEIGAEYVGIMNSRFFPPVALLTNGEISSPVKIYESVENNMVILLSNVMLEPILSYDVSKAIVDWAQDINVSEMISIAGIITMSGEQKVFGGATNSGLLDKIRDHTTIFEAGTITGIPGSVMVECQARDIPGISLLGETSSQNPDPRAAAQVVKAINSIYGLDIN